MLIFLSLRPLRRYKRALAVKHENQETLYYIGSLLADEEIDFDGAEDCFRRALKARARAQRKHTNKTCKRLSS